ncbi:MAG: ribosome-associated translation inhibitor RaiA [Planctomycetes bacterium]|nr:ribosome-associated translation inhibitor RaiA [Planctomycetota bacterium]
MDVRITARHCQLSASLEQFIRSKIMRLERFVNRLHDAQVVVVSAGGQATVEMTVGWTKGQQFSARAEGDSPRSAVLRAQAKLEKQLRRLKARILRRRADAA